MNKGIVAALQWVGTLDKKHPRTEPRGARSRFGGSQVRLAEVFGISQPTLHRLLHGKTLPTFTQAFEWEKRTGIKGLRFKLAPHLFGKEADG